MVTLNVQATPPQEQEHSHSSISVYSEPDPPQKQDPYEYVNEVSIYLQNIYKDLQDSYKIYLHSERPNDSTETNARFNTVNDHFTICRTLMLYELQDDAPDNDDNADALMLYELQNDTPDNNDDDDNNDENDCEDDNDEDDDDEDENDDAEDDADDDDDNDLVASKTRPSLKLSKMRSF